MTQKTIAPETTFEEIFQQFPDLEPVLFKLIPQFVSLKNPVLRAAVARVTTLSQAASTAGVSLGDLVRELRIAAGLDRVDAVKGESDSGIADLPAYVPSWVKEFARWKTLDARPIIESGGHPLQQVMSELSVLPEKKIYELITPFVPGPLIERTKAAGFTSISVTEKSDTIRTFFIRG